MDTPKSPQKSAKKAVKEPAPDATEESFIGFDDSEINKRRIISLQSIIGKSHFVYTVFYTYTCCYLEVFFDTWLAPRNLSAT